MNKALGRSPVTGRALADEIQHAETRYKEAATAADAAREARNEIVREALAAGWTHAQIAKATGLTRGRIGQLVS